MKITIRFFICLLLTYSFLKTSGQLHSETDLLRITKENRKSLPGQVMYIITDRDVYVPGESLWLAAYLLERWPVPDSLQPDILSIGLRKQGANTLSISKSFLIQKGICSGS